MKVKLASPIAMWCALTATLPSRPASTATSEKTPISASSWKPIGVPSRITFQTETSVASFAAPRGRIGSTTSSTPPASTRLATVLARPAPNAPSGGTPTTMRP